MPTERLDDAKLRDVLVWFNRHDLDGILAFFAQDAVFESPRGPHPWGTRFEGQQAVREGASGWTLTGTTTDGVRLEVRGCDLWEFTDGLVIRKDSYWKLVEQA